VTLKTLGEFIGRARQPDTLVGIESSVNRTSALHEVPIGLLGQIGNMANNGSHNSETGGLAVAKSNGALFDSMLRVAVNYSALCWVVTIAI